MLELLDKAGLFEETLFVVTADHGMAPQDVSLRANPTGHVIDAGLSAIVAEPMIWLRDLAVTTERAPDGRTARVIVCDNDADASGGQPALGGAEVLVEAHREGAAPRAIAQGQTSGDGIFGFATPSELDSRQIGISVRAAGFNARRVLLDGTRLPLDLRAALYGAKRGRGAGAGSRAWRFLDRSRRHVHDCIAIAPDGALHARKLLRTTGAGRAIHGVLRESRAGGQATAAVVRVTLGTTVATTLLERRGARHLLATTRGLGDLLTIGRRNGPTCVRARDRESRRPCTSARSSSPAKRCIRARARGAQHGSARCRARRCARRGLRFVRRARDPRERRAPLGGARRNPRARSGFAHFVASSEIALDMACSRGARRPVADATYPASARASRIARGRAARRDAPLHAVVGRVTTRLFVLRVRCSPARWRRDRRSARGARGRVPERDRPRHGRHL